MDCATGFKCVKYCPCDGLNSTECPLWPFRFGTKPQTARRKYGAELLDPKAMPPAGTPLENLP